MVDQCEMPFPGQRANSVSRAGKENQVSIGIEDDEVFGAPRLLFQSLMERHSCCLKTGKKLFDLVCGCDCERSGEQMLAFANIAREHGFADHP